MMKSRWFGEGIEFLSNASLRQKLSLLICLGFLLRLYVVLNAVTLSVDSTVDLRLAMAFHEGDFFGGIDKERPPLHPFLVSLIYPVFKDYEFSARIISLIFGTLVIPLSFYLGRLVYNERVGLITAFFVAIQSYLIRYSGETLREGLYHFFVVILVTLGLKVIFARGIQLMFLMGIVSFLAYMTKQHAIGFLMITSLWIIFYNIRDMGKDWDKRLKLLLSGWTLFILMALPYLFFLFHETGNITITGRTDPNAMLISIYKTVTLGNENLVLFLRRFLEAFSIPFFILFLGYVFKRAKQGFASSEYYMFTIFLSYLLLHLFMNPERRYITQLMPMALVFSAAGFSMFNEWVLEAKGKKKMISAFLVLIIAAIQIPQGLVELHSNRLPEKLAGRWLLENNGRGTIILADKPITAYYADASHAPLPEKVMLKDLIRYGKTMGAEYVAGYPSKLREAIPDFDFDTKEKRLLLRVKSFRGVGDTFKEEEFVIYRLLPESP